MAVCLGLHVETDPNQMRKGIHKLPQLIMILNVLAFVLAHTLSESCLRVKPFASVLENGGKPVCSRVVILVILGSPILHEDL